MFNEIFNRPSASASFRIDPASGLPSVELPEILRRIERAASDLRTAGVGPGQRVLFCGDQGLAAFVMFWATVANGAAFAPIDASWPALLAQRGLRRIRPSLALIESSLTFSGWHAVTAEVPRLEVGAAGELQNSPATSIPHPAARGVREAANDTPAACLLTSGSTAEPKVVVLSQQALLHSARLVTATFAWSAGERLLNLPDPHTMSGLRNALLAAPLAGMHWICAPRRDRADMFALLEMLHRVRAQRVVAAPLLIRHINLSGNRVPEGIFSDTRALYCTGTDLNPLEVAQFHERFRIPVVNYYGLTETVGLCLSQRVNGWQAGDPSVGHPAGCEIRITSDDGQESADGTEGELQVRQRYPMSGYLDDPQATAAMFSGGWLRTGDIAKRRADGSVVLVGRRATFIKAPTTEKIHPQEIEAVLELHTAISEAAVCGLADRAGGERIAALLVARENAPAPERVDREIAQFVAERLGAARTPKVIRWVPSIARSANGKIIRSQLRDHFNE